ncbi:hypothetical protein [Methyloceanibacter methanicus]|uniref:hypothetical protein n=1 Tax=Methyloceanibacter methanicus TaxID=1774968 RepID=UPI0018745274|nr:hypothetical protein [Methyloceanibacter methanicus]
MQPLESPSIESSLPQAELIHAIPGRCRLRIPARRGDAVFFAAIASGLSTLQGVLRADVTPLTGSIVIHHELPLERIAKAARDVQLFALDPTRVGRVTAPAEVLSLDPNVLAALGFGALALLQVSRGQILPQAVTLAWYAAALADWLQPPGPIEEAGGDGGD